MRDLFPHQIFDSFENIVDWGCGPGVASQSFWDEGEVKPHQIAWLKDRSSLAEDFARSELQSRGWTGAFCCQRKQAPTGLGTLVLVSHVVTEFSDQGSELFDALKDQGGFVWVEPGTPFCSTILVQLRERLREQGFVALAPCPQTGPCPFSNQPKPQPEQTTNGVPLDWCHFQARSAPQAFHSAFWSKVASELSLDLRDLPLCYLVMVKKEILEKVGHVAQPHSNRGNSEMSVVLGRSFAQGAQTKVLLCKESGLVSKNLSTKRDRLILKKIEKMEPGEQAEGIF